MKDPREFKIIADNAVVFHHFYIGILLMGWAFPMNIIGILVMLDDVVEHLFTEDTPLRILFDKLIAPQLR